MDCGAAPTWFRSGLDTRQRTGRRWRYPARMASLRPISIRRDGRTRYLVNIGVRLAAVEGDRIAVHFMLSYGVPENVVRRVLSQAWLSAEAPPPVPVPPPQDQQ